MGKVENVRHVSAGKSCVEGGCMKWCDECFKNETTDHEALATEEDGPVENGRGSRPPLPPLRFSVAAPEVTLSENGNASPPFPLTSTKFVSHKYIKLCSAKFQS